MNCCKHKYLVIYRGDDTDFPGNQELIIELNTTRDLAGCKAHFSFQGFAQDFNEIPADKKLRLIIPNSATSKFPIGAADAKLWLTNGTKVRTVESRIHIVVTNRVDEAYDNNDPQAITVTIKGTDLTWENIKNKPLLVKTVNGEAPDADGNVEVTAIAEGAVQYDREQTLTDAQKSQAQKNIGTFGKLPLRALPPYLHYLPFDDTYPADAQAFYDSLGGARVMGGCSIVRKGGLVGGNFDYPYDDACSFAIKVSSGKGANADGSDRHASVGAAYLGTRLTENIVSSGVSTPLYRVLPGMTESGINDAGVYAKINVIPRDEIKDPVQSETRDLHALAVVRYVLDHFDNAADAATYVAAHYYIPEGSADSYHWMIADKDETYVVEDGSAFSSYSAITNYRVVSGDEFGSGHKRMEVLEGSGTVAELLSAVRYTNAYAEGWPWPDEFAGQTDAQGKIPHTATDRLKAWANEHVAPLLDENRKPAARGNGCLQTVHSAIYDFEKKTMAICVQEDFSKRYVFAVDQANVDLSPIEEQIAALQNGKLDKTSVVPASTNAADGAAAEAKTARHIADMNAYGEQLGAWVHGELPEGFVLDDRPFYSNDHWEWAVVEVPEGEIRTFFDAFVTEDVDEATFRFVSNPTYTFHATRAKSLAPTGKLLAADNPQPASGSLAKFAADGKMVAAVPGTDYLTQHQDISGKQDKITASGVLKGDGLGGVTEATKSSTSADPANADYRDPQDNTCHKTEGLWTPNNPPTGITLDGQPYFDDSLGWTWKTVGDLGRYYGSHDPDSTDEYFTEIDGAYPSFTATRTAVCTSNELYTTKGYVDGKVSAAVSTNNPAFVSAVRNTPTSGMPEDIPTDWGTYGTVGAALAALAAFVKWAKAKIVAVIDNDGKPTDQFATDLMGKQVANAKVRYALATTSSATMADRTVNLYTLSSGTVPMVFPTATTHDGKTYARDFLLKLTYSGGTLQMPTGVTKVGDELSFEAGKTYLIAFTEIAADKFYVRSIDITEAQA